MTRTVSPSKPYGGQITDSGRGCVTDRASRSVRLVRGVQQLLQLVGGDRAGGEADQPLERDTAHHRGEVDAERVTCIRTATLTATGDGTHGVPDRLRDHRARHRLGERGGQRQRDVHHLALELYLSGSAQVTAARADGDNIPARFQHRGSGAGVAVLQVAAVDVDLQLGTLAGVKGHRPESTESLRDALHRGLRHGHIGLDNLPAAAGPGVRHPDDDGEALTVVVGLGEDPVVGEGGVAQSVAEGEGDRELTGVIPAVADVQPL